MNPEDFDFSNWSWEDKRLGAAILGMIGSIALFKELEFDPTEVCKRLSDDDNIERIIGRRLYGQATALLENYGYQIDSIKELDVNIKPENVKVSRTTKEELCEQMAKNGDFDLPGQYDDFEPLWDYILAKPVEENVTKGGIQLPEGTRVADVKKALVVKAGKGAYRESGAFIENPVKAGDCIYMMAHVKPFIVPINGVNHICLSGRDVVAITKRKE